MYTGTHTHTHRLVPDSLTKTAFPLHLISSMYVGLRLLTRKKPGHKSSSLEVSSKMESGPCLHQEGDRGRSEVNLSSCGVGVTSLVSTPSLGLWPHCQLLLGRIQFNAGLCPQSEERFGVRVSALL